MIICVDIECALESEFVPACKLHYIRLMSLVSPHTPFPTVPDLIRMHCPICCVLVAYAYWLLLLVPWQCFLPKCNIHWNLTIKVTHGTGQVTLMER